MNRLRWISDTNLKPVYPTPVPDLKKMENKAATLRKQLAEAEEEWKRVASTPKYLQGPLYEDKLDEAFIKVSNIRKQIAEHAQGCKECEMPWYNCLCSHDLDDGC